MWTLKLLAQLQELGEDWIILEEAIGDIVT